MLKCKHCGAEIVHGVDFVNGETVPALDPLSERGPWEARWLFADEGEVEVRRVIPPAASAGRLPRRFAEHKCKEARRG